VTRKETVLVKWGEDIDQTVNKDDRMCYCMSGAAREIPLKTAPPVSGLNSGGGQFLRWRLQGLQACRG
jgi:hypothetical protein